jgi:FkbM family methyltransferase
MKSLILRLLEKFGIGITSSENLENLKAGQAELIHLRNFFDFQNSIDDSAIPSNMAKKATNFFSLSKAQLHQDLIALIFSDFKTGGFFVEFGATDGRRFSNTHLLEKSFNWNGILAEPGRNWHSSLRVNRSAIIETRCVWKTSGESLEFNETAVGELSTLEMFSSGDMHADARLSGNRYYVDTISLEDLLKINDAPQHVDYLSIDTEGSEFEILSNFDFGKYSFGFITCEHNFTQSREQVFELLTANGYVRVLENMSQFDDWYLHNSLVKAE